MPAARPKKENTSATPPSDDGQHKDSHAENSKSKRKRQSQSCDACRARKVRCARENADDPKQSCRHCITLGIPCTYDYQPKKRGPPNLYLRRLQEAAAAASSNSQPESAPADQAEPPINTASPPQHIVTSPLVTKSPTAFLEPTLAPHPNVPTSMTLPPSRYPIAADTYHNAQYPSHTPQSPSFSGPRSAVEPSGPSLLHGHASPKTEETPYPPDQYNNYPGMFNQWSYKQPQMVPLPPPQAVPPLSYYHRPLPLAPMPTFGTS